MAALLVVEDEAVLAKSIRRSLSRLGHEVTLAASLAEAERALEEGAPKLMLLDMELPDGSGLGLLERLGKAGEGISVIVMTAYARDEYEARTAALGARACLQKPLNLTELAEVVERCLEGRAE